MCAVKSYTFENVRRTHTIEVAFMKAGGNSQTGVFVDVPSGSYYEEAVNWAVENGITKGTTATGAELQPRSDRHFPVALREIPGSRHGQSLYRREAWHLLCRCGAVGRQGGRHQGHHHHVQPQRQLHESADRHLYLARPCGIARPPAKTHKRTSDSAADGHSPRSCAVPFSSYETI